MQQLVYRDTEKGIEIPLQLEAISGPKDGFCPLLVVKLGDPTTSWIPDQEEVEAVQKLFDEMGVGKTFHCFYYHYGIELQTIQLPKEQPVLLLVGVGDRTSGWTPEKDEQDAVEKTLKELLQDLPNVKVKVIPFSSALLTEQTEKDVE